MRISSPALLLVSSLLCASLAAQTMEDFETLYVAPGSSWPTLVSSLNHTTVLPPPGGGGPGLVEPGCTYSCTTGYINWVGDGYYNLSTRKLTANSTPLITLTYDPPVTTFSVDLHSYDGFPDFVTVNVYAPGGVLISTGSGLSVPDSSPVTFAHSGMPVETVEFINTLNFFSPLIDNNYYGDLLSYAVTPLVSGTMATLSVVSATPGGDVMGGYSLTGAGPTTTPLGLVNMSPPISTLPMLTANSGGLATFSAMIPPRLSGLTVYTQAADLATSTLTNSLTLPVL